MFEQSQFRSGSLQMKGSLRDKRVQTAIPLSLVVLSVHTLYVMRQIISALNE